MTLKMPTLARLSAVLLAVGLAGGLAGGLVGCTEGGSGNGPESPANSPTETYDPHDEDPNNGGLSMEQGGSIATDEYGGTITSIEGDDYKGEPAWEVELEGSSEGRIEVKVSKATGQILEVEND